MVASSEELLFTYEVCLGLNLRDVIGPIDHRQEMSRGDVEFRFIHELQLSNYQKDVGDNRKLFLLALASDP